MQSILHSFTRPRPSRILVRLLCLPAHREIIMPKVSPTMTHGRLIAWKKAEGDAIEDGEDIADIESDKAVMPIAAREEDCFLARIFVPEDTPDIPLGTLLAITVEEQEDLPKFKDYRPPDERENQAKVADAHATNVGMKEAEAPPAEQKGPKYSGPLGPAIMRLLNEYPNLNLDGITPTGPQGRLLKGDILTALDAGTAFTPAPVASAPAPSTAPEATATTTTNDSTSAARPDAPGGVPEAQYTDVPVSSMRRAIARRLLQSKTTVPHRYATATYTLDALLALRKRLNVGEPSPAISVNDFMLRAIGVALRRVPEMNVAWDVGREEAVRNAVVDVSMAVAIDGGLITPIVKAVDRKGLAEIAVATKDLVSRARAGGLDPEEYEGGGFSLTNLGMFGVKRFAAIINPPQSGILAVGSGVPEAVMHEDGSISTVMQGIATLSTDARSVGEDTAAKFLKEFSRCMSDPETMLM